MKLSARGMLSLMIAASLAGPTVGAQTSSGAAPVPSQADSVGLDLNDPLPAMHPSTRALVQQALAGSDVDADTKAKAARQLLADGLAASASSLYADLLRSGARSGFETRYLAAYAAELGWDSTLALKRLKGALEARPDYAPGWLRLATHLLQLGNIEAAGQAVDRAASLADLDAYGWYLRGRIGMQSEAWLDAVNGFEQALRLQPGASAVYAALAQAYALSGNESRAQWARDRRGPIKPGLSDPLIADLIMESNSVGQLAEAGGRALESGDPGRALALLSRAASLSESLSEPLPASVLFNLGLTHLQLGAPDAARDELERALMAEPGFTDAYLALARVEQEANNVAAAEAHYRSALELNSGHYAGRVNLANLLLRRERWADALPHYQWVIDANPSERTGYLGAIRSLAGLGRYAELADLLDRAAGRLPNDALLFEYRLRYLASFAPERIDARIWARAQALAQQNPTPGTLEALAMVYAARGEFQPAIAVMQRRAERLARAGQEEDAFSRWLLEGFTRGEAARSPGISDRAVTR